MKKIVKRGLVWSFAVFSVLMTFLSESIFSNCSIVNKEIIESSKYFSWLDVDAFNITIMRNIGVRPQCGQPCVNLGAY